MNTLINDKQSFNMRALGVGLILLAPPISRADEPQAIAPASGKIYAAVGLQANQPASLVAFDPATGEGIEVLPNCGSRPRVSPDGKTVAFVRQGALWTRSIAGGDEPRRVLNLDEDSHGSPPVWSGDGQQIVISPATRDEKVNHWAHRTIRVNTDGTGKTDLPIPQEDGVYDWSPDGKWFVTASSRQAKIGWQLYVLRPNGKNLQQITEGGNPYYVRFAPDSRRVLYSDGTSEERRGIWVVDIDGTNRRKICSTGKANTSACWSPGGKQIAVAFRHFTQQAGEKDVIEVMDLDGQRVSLMNLPDASGIDMPDWR